MIIGILSAGITWLLWWNWSMMASTTWTIPSRIASRPRDESQLDCQMEIIDRIGITLCAVSRDSNRTSKLHPLFFVITVVVMTKFGTSFHTVVHVTITRRHSG